MSQTLRQRRAVLAQRREALLTRGAAQRQAMAQAWALMEPPMVWLNLGWHAARLVRQHPWAWALPGLALGGMLRRWPRLAWWAGWLARWVQRG